MSNLDSKDPKLEWMYKGTKDLLNREDYLLGRTVDKNFEIQNAEEQKEKESHLLGVTVPKNHVEYECIPFSIREYRSLQSTDQVDIQRKILEDPLMAIKQKEIESRRKLLENPVKLKELHNILKMEKLEQSNKKKKSKKSKKKKKKKSHSSSSGDSNDSYDSDNEKDLDKLLAKKYKKVKNSLDDDELNPNMDFEKILNNKFKKLSKELDEMTKTKNKKSKKKRKRSSTSESSSSSSSRSDSDEKSKKSYNRSKNVEPKDVRHNFITRHLNMNSRPKSYSRPNFNHEDFNLRKSRRSISRDNRSNSRHKEQYSTNDQQDSRKCRSRSRNEGIFNYRNSNSRNKEQYSARNEQDSRKNSHTDHKRSRSRNEDNSNYRSRRSHSRNKDEYSTRNQQDSRKYSDRDDKPRSNSRNEPRNSYYRNRRSHSRNKEEYSETHHTQGSRKSFYSDDNQYSKTISKITKPLIAQLTEEDKEKLRQEMMQHGVKRNEERTNKVKEYRKNVDIEENNQKSTFDHNFANKEMRKAYTASTSMESRIKSKLNNIQRTSRAMDSNFARK